MGYSEQIDRLIAEEYPSDEEREELKDDCYDHNEPTEQERDLVADL